MSSMGSKMVGLPITVLKKIKRTFKTCEKNTCKLFGIKNNKIIFNNFFGSGYADNGKYICEELLKRNKDIDIVWTCQNNEQVFSDGIRTVKYGSLKSYYEWATAKVWVDNIRNTDKPTKREGQIYLQTWHAPFSPKCLEKDADTKLDEIYIKKSKYDGSVTDGILASSFIHEQQYKRAFYLSKSCEILKCGLPRNDLFFEEGVYDKFREKYNFSKDDYIIVYAPTFRDNGRLNAYLTDFNSVVDAFKEVMNKECKMIVRMHPNVDVKAMNIAYNDTIINGNLIADMQELAALADVIITDYSTTMFDFSIQNKPVFLYCSDVEEYNEDRGLLDDFYDLPFRRSSTTSELIKQIKEFNIEQYQQEVLEYEKKSPSYDKGDASKQVVDWILKRLEE